MRRALPILVVVALLLGVLFAFRDAPPGAPPVTTLTPELAALRDAFNDDVSKVRLLLLVDPT